MSLEERRSSDPARDLVRALSAIKDVGGDSVIARRIAAAANVQIHTSEFYLTIKLLQDVLNDVHSTLLHQGNLDAEDKADIDSNINRLRSLFDQNNLYSELVHVSRPGFAMGPEVITFLNTSSRMIRSTNGYLSPNESDCGVFRQAIESIRADLSDVRLERVDFAREALLRGANEVSFLIERIDFFGFSRVEAPIMEMSAFLFTISSEFRDKDGNVDSIRRSLSAVANAYDRVRKLTEALEVARIANDGVQWLIGKIVS